MNRSKLEVFANESKKFCENMDHWIHKFGQESHASGLSRTDALQARTELERIERALRWGPSVGVYGESQCGKSNLVSRFAQGLGAEMAEDGGLLISDPSPQSNHAKVLFILILSKNIGSIIFGFIFISIIGVGTNQFVVPIFFTIRGIAQCF